VKVIYSKIRKAKKKVANWSQQNFIQHLSLKLEENTGNLKRRLTELLPLYACVIVPETQKSSESHLQEGTGRISLPLCGGGGFAHPPQSHSALTSDISRIPADDALHCNQQCYSLKKPNDLRFPNLIESSWKLGTLKSRHFRKCLLIP